METCTKFSDINDVDFRITTFTEGHITDKYISWLNDPSVVQYSEQRHFKHTYSTCKNYYELQKQSNNFFLAIEHLVYGHIGNIGVNIDINNNTADQSIIVGDYRARGKGFGGRAWNSTLTQLIDKYGFRIVTAGTMEINKPMLKIIESSQMKICAYIPKRFICKGIEIGLVIASTK